MSLEGGIPLLRVIEADGKLKLETSGAELLDGHDGPLDIITCFGPTRHGKSWLLSYLIDRAGAFKSTNGGPETQGVDVVRSFTSLSDFERRWGDTSARSAGKSLALLDVEGMGDNSAEHGMKLLTPVAVLSKVLIYNLGGIEGKDKLLNQLACIYTVARGMTQEKGRPVLLGHLHILVRNYTGQLDAAEFSEYIREPEEVEYTEDKEGADKRNNIRSSLQKWFRSITVHLFSTPAAPDVIRTHESLPFGLVNDKFRSEVKSLAKLMITQLNARDDRDGFLRAGVGSNGQTHVAALEKLVEFVNENEGKFKIPSLVEGLHHNLCRRATMDAIEVASVEVTKLGEELEALVKQSGTSVEAVTKAVQAARPKILEAARARFYEVAGNVPTSISGKYVEDVERQVTSSIEAKETEHVAEVKQRELRDSMAEAEKESEGTKKKLEELKEAKTEQDRKHKKDMEELLEKFESKVRQYKADVSRLEEENARARASASMQCAGPSWGGNPMMGGGGGMPSLDMMGGGMPSGMMPGMGMGPSGFGSRGSVPMGHTPMGTYSSRGSANGSALFQGPRGGVYYNNSSGGRTYVTHKFR